ncbi:DNA-binding response regulator [Zobellella endophytica]|uniref:DNA-binding response regulator n=1 Tax=Zobellella endophytica TaxID=2116700 RepID=A0A2P7RB46_9GAMM|nr:response regulator [Zobellella endophytica]PSJ47441.1 DNA-binding response regulator [Zobellella endophytica]
MDISILIVEDDDITRDCLVEYFKTEQYRVYSTECAEQAEKILQDERIDLVLLDIRLPGKDGLTLTREIRANAETGIILVTSRQDEIERIIGLECGADEYVSKPFNPRELLARAKNLARRVRAAANNQPVATTGNVRQFDDWRFDLDRRVLIDGDDQQTPLTHGEYQLLCAFIRHSGQTLSRDQLLDQIKNREWAPNDRTVDVLVGRLRRKLGDNPAHPKTILTVHGTGYVFTPRPVPCH